MISLVTPKLREFAERLLDHEAAETASMDVFVPSAYRVCEKLRHSLTMLAGATGFHSLVFRALTLAKRDAPILDAVRVKEDGSLENGHLESDQIDSEGGVLLIAHLIGLLFTFVGETLTLRLMCDIWPDASFDGKGIRTAKTLTAEGTGKHEPQE